MSAKELSYRQLAIGVILGLAVGLGLIAWLGGAGRRTAGESAAEQTSVVTLSALTELVSATRAAEGDVQEVVSRFAAGRGDLVWARVVDVKKRRLEASTVAADLAAGEMPQRLDRKNEDHKTWYDLGQSLRSAVDANRAEGRLWKEEVFVERLAGGHLSLAAPLEDGGDVVGIVLVEAVGRSLELAGGAPSFWRYLILAALLNMVASWLLHGRRWLPAMAAGVVVVAALVGYGSTTLASLSQVRQAVEEGVASQVADEARRFADVSAASAEASPAAWDVDRFRSPRGIVAADGGLDAGGIRAAFAQARGRFRTSFAAIGLLALGLAAFVGLGGALRAWRTLVRHREAYSFVAPAMVGMLILVFFPFLFGITLSFTNQSLYNLNEPIYEIWVGFENYVRILTDFDIVRDASVGGGIDYENFYWTLGFTILWTVANVAIGVTLGLALALVLNTKGLAFRPFYRVLLILPWAVPNYITALIWKGMFHQQFGVVNQVFQIFGAEPVAWFDNTFTSFVAVVTTNGWLSFPFMMVVALGGLQSIPSDLYEAARIDGAGRWQQFTNVTLPSLKPVMVPAIILSVVWTFNMFNIIFLVSAGDPGGATEILITRAFKLFYEQYQYGFAAAYATVIFGILLVYGTWQNRATKATEGV